MIDVTALLNRPLLISVQCFVVVQLLIVDIGVPQGSIMGPHKSY